MIVQPWLFMYLFSAASAQAAGRCVFGEGRVTNFYDNVNCMGAESSLNECQPPYILSNQICGYAGVFCQSKYFISTYVWFYLMFLLVAVTIDSSKTRPTTGFPLPTSTVNHATSSISTSGNVEQNYYRVLFICTIS